MQFKEQHHYNQLSNNGTPFSFVHANAYTPECYYPLLSSFADHFSLYCYKLKAIRDDAGVPDIKSWMDFTHDYDAFLSEKKLSNVIGIGHSIGAIMTLLAELKTPGRFKKIILLDPVLFSIHHQGFVLLYKLIIGHLPFVKKTYQRQVTFPSKDDVYKHYRTKHIFRYISDAHLRTLSDALFRNDENVVKLIQSPEWEAAIYKAGSTCFPYFWKCLSQIKCPILLLAADQSNVCKQKEINKMQKKCQNLSVQIVKNTTHLLPFEDVKVVQKHIENFIL